VLVGLRAHGLGKPSKGAKGQQELVLTGGSAGGFGVFVNVDWAQVERFYLRICCEFLK